MAEHDDASPDPGVLFSTSEEYFPAARQELLELSAPDGEVRRLGPDLGRLTGPEVRLDRLARQCREVPVVFVQHLTAEVDVVPLDTAADPGRVVDSVRRVTEPLAPGPLAVQAWVSGRNPLPYGTAELAQHATGALAEAGWQVGRAGLPHTLSLCVTKEGVSLGLAPTADQLADWPGGRSRLARSGNQISRAEFKLEEAFQAFGLAPPADGTALDLGASPGGWTRILRERGITVCAVDPGDLDPRLRHDRGVRHVRTTASEFLRTERDRFDLVVNDMKMDPERSCQIVLDVADRLRPDAVAVVTLKLSSHRPLQVVRRCLRLLGRRYRVRAARQLHHNRHEVTVVAQRR